MDFKKDLSILANYCPTGNGKLVEVEQGETKLKFLVSRGICINTSIFNGDKIKLVLEAISNDFRNKELEEGKTNSLKFSNKYYANMFESAIESEEYTEEMFDRFEGGNVSVADKVRGLPLGIMSKLIKQFEEVTFHYEGDFIVGINTRTSEYLFIVSTVEMFRQLNLLGTQDNLSLPTNESSTED